MGEKEWYFFCRRGRKYRNSVRPNRVTGFGFWKATGIDKPIYSEGRRDCCIGLKKSLVFYRGSAGKVTKTDWMMHEFRLPPPDYHHNNTPKNIHFNDDLQEAEVWTLCRILKRNTSQRKCMANWRDISTSKRNNPTLDASSKPCSAESDNLQGYNISFTSTTSPIHIRQNNEHKPAAIYFSNHVNEPNQLAMTSISQAPSSVISSYSNFSSPEVSKFRRYGEWDELRSIMDPEFANDPF